MLTRCPACQTIFRVAPEQLAARDGRVRCGHCLVAFNALQNGIDSAPSQDTAATPEAATATPPLAPSPAPIEAEPVEGFSMEIVLDEDGDGEDQAPDTPPKPAAREEPLPAVVHTRTSPLVIPSAVTLQDEWEQAQAANCEETADLAEESEALAVEETPDAAPVFAAPPLTTADSVEDEFTHGAPIFSPTPALASAGNVGQGHLGVAIGCLAAALVVQTTFLFRQPLTQALPALRPPLVALCDRLGCALPLPQNAELIGIETSDLHPEPGDKGEFVLHATLRNRAGFPQAYPYVELSLTDAGDKALVRRVFSPAEWAPRLSQTDEGFAPGASAEVTLPFNAAGVAALGYRVYAFYP